MPRPGRKGSISYARKACFFTWRTSIGARQQSLPVSYFWLMEAFRYQSPSVVVNSSEAAVRLAMDSMRWSLPACMYKIRRQRSNHIS